MHYRMAINLNEHGQVIGGYIERYRAGELQECIVMAPKFFRELDQPDDAAMRLYGAILSRFGLQERLFS